jgi:hypothetical protein
MSSSKLSGLDPLKDLLSDVLSRLEALEAKAGVGSGTSAPPAGSLSAGGEPIPTTSFHGTSSDRK